MLAITTRGTIWGWQARGPLTEGALRTTPTSAAAGADGNSRQGLFRVDCRYSYVVDGREYESSTLAPTSSQRWGRRRADEIIAELKASTRLTVRYNRNDPSNACLVLQAWGQDKTYSYLLGAFFILCIVMLVGGVIRPAGVSTRP